MTQAPPGAAEEVTISQRGSELEIVRRWFNRRTIAVTVFVVVLTPVLGLALSKIGVLDVDLLRFSGLVGFDNWLSLLMNFVLLGAAVFYAYKVVAEWTNRTHVIVNPEVLLVRHGPLPWPGVGPVARADIKQVHANQSSSMSGRGQHARVTYTYGVHAETHDGTKIALLSGFATQEPALLVKQEIDKYLGLKPVPEQAASPATPRQHTGEAGTPGVVAIWLFILIWNGAVWSIPLLFGDSAGRKHPEAATVFFALFALIGFGLICVAIPFTWKFIRQKAPSRPDLAAQKDAWKIVIALLVIGAGFAAILTFGMLGHNEQAARLRELQAPPAWHK